MHEFSISRANTCTVATTDENSTGQSASVSRPNSGSRTFKGRCRNHWELFLARQIDQESHGGDRAFSFPCRRAMRQCFVELFCGTPFASYANGWQCRPSIKMNPV